MLARFSTDVLPHAPTYCLVLGGINDIQQDSTAAAIEANLSAIYQDCRVAGIVPVPMTITPWAGYVNWTQARENVRLAVNSWIRGLGSPLVDLETVVGDGNTPPALQAQYDSGDHLHPNAAGSQAIAAAILSQSHI